MDEYDKPLIDYLDEPAKLDANRSVFKQFYSVLKDSDQYIRLLFLTGVSRFSRVSIFLDLNNLEDITVGKNFNSLVGITQTELERDFVPELDTYPDLFSLDKPELIRLIKEGYNGYSWGGAETLYNPFSLLNFMKQQEFCNYRFATGSPTLLIKGIKKRGD